MARPPRQLVTRLTIVTALVVGPLRAQEVGDFPKDAILERELGPFSVIDARCRMYAFYESSREGLKTCRGVDPGVWKAQAEAFRTAASEYLWLTAAGAVGACKPAVPPAFTLEDAALAAADKSLTEAQSALAQALITDPAAGSAAARQAAKERDAAQSRVEVQRKALTERKSAAAKDARASLEQRIEAFDAAVVAATRGGRDAATFEAIAKAAIDTPAPNAPPSRADACAKLYADELATFSSASTLETERALDAIAREAHEADTLRKASSSATAATTASAVAEHPGTPDYIIYSILSALGAEERSTGTQLAVTLNLSSLIWPESEARLAQPVGYRNIFLRAAFPLDATSAETPAPAAESTDPGDSVRRVSLVLGGSFFDEADTRLDANRRCYEAALAYASFAPTVEADESALAERRAYFDICNRLVVNRARLAWRAGLGFVSEAGDDDDDDTKPEMYAGVLVWAPTSQLYTNLIYQRYLRPRTVHAGGVAVSVAGNAGGGTSGTTAWARAGVDLTFMVGHDTDADATSWELRLAPTIRGRVLGDSVTSVALGPLLKSDGDPALLATVTFGYDADRIMSRLLEPLP